MLKILVVMNSWTLAKALFQNTGRLIETPFSTQQLHQLFMNILGPQDELEYWKKRGAQFSQIVNQVNSREVMLTLLCLKLSHSKVTKEWKETDKKITFCYNEAKDNAKFIQALETKCHSLYLDDPVSIIISKIKNPANRKSEF